MIDFNVWPYLFYVVFVDRQLGTLNIVVYVIGELKIIQSIIMDVVDISDEIIQLDFQLVRHLLAAFQSHEEFGTLTE